MTHSTSSFWEEFYKLYYWEQILELASAYPDVKSLPVKFTDLEMRDMDVARELLDSPDTVLGHATEALRGVDIPADVELNKAEVRIHGLPCMKLREIRIEHVNKLIAVTGTIIKETGVGGRALDVGFRCARCGDITHIHQTDPIKFVEPFECQNDSCGRKGPFSLEEKESSFVDTKKIRLQELFGELRGGQHPQTMDLEFIGDLSSLCQAGDDVTITGIVRLIQRTTAQGKTPRFDYSLEVNFVEMYENHANTEITTEDKEKIAKLAKDPRNTDRIVASFANSIRGHKLIKEGLLVCSVSSGSILLPDGSVKRGTSNILLIGDPGTAKTQLIRAITNLVPGAQYCTGDGSTKAGLTAAVVKDDFGDGRWSLEAGALVLANGSLAAIDELYMTT